MCRFNFCVYFLIFCLLGCKQELSLRNAIPFCEINVNQITGIKEFTNFDDSICLLPLEISKSNISVPSKIMVYKDKIFILDKIIRKQLCAFSMTGEFLYNIGNKGRGNGEYLQPYDFDIRNDSIFIIDSSIRKVLSYSTEGDFLKSYDQPRAVDGILALNNGNFLLSVSEFEKDSKYRLVQVDGNMHEMAGILLMDKEKVDDKVADNVFQRVGESVFYQRSFEDEILELSLNGEVKQNIKVNFKREHVPLEYKTKEYEKLKEALQSHDYEYFIDCPIIAKNRLYANCFIGKNKATIVIDKDTGVEYDNIFDIQKKTQDVHDLLFPKTYYDNQIVGWFDGSLLPLFEKECIMPDDITQKLEQGEIILCFYKII